MSDEGTLPEPDITVAAPVLDPENPLLDAFAYQHDLRQRFLEAMREAVEVLRGIVAVDPDNAPRMLVEIQRAQAILDEALDPDAIGVWITEGRPLKSIPAEVEARGAQIDRVVSTIAVTARYNVWAYDPQYDDWSLLYEELNASEANEQLELREAGGREGIEYIILPVGEEPRVTIQ